MAAALRVFLRLSTLLVIFAQYALAASTATNRHYVTVWSNSGKAASVRVGPDGIDDQQCRAIGCQSVSDTRVCTTPGCVLAAARLMGSIDTSVDPCDDFFEYACGKYIDTHPIAEDKAQHGVFDDLIEDVTLALRRLLERKPTTPPRSRVLQQVANVYAACMNTSEIEKRGAQPALAFLAQNSPWPAVQPALYSDGVGGYDLLRSMVNMARMGSSAIIAIGIDVDSKDPTRRLLSVDQASLGMPSRDYLLGSSNDTIVQAYYQYMLSVAAILDEQRLRAAGASTADIVASRARIEAELPAVLDFEIQLANLTTPKELRRDPVRLYNKMTIAELQKQAPSFDWLRFVNLYLKDSGLQVDEKEEIVVTEPQFMKDVLNFLKQTPLRVVANYVAWRHIKDFIFDLDKSLQEPRMRYQHLLTGITIDPPRWKTCISRASSAMPMGTGRLYVESEFDAMSKGLSETLLSNIRAAFDEILDENEWLGPVERKLSHEKLAAIVKQIGYDDRLLNDTWLDEYHRDNVGVPDDHFGNTVRNQFANVIFQQRRLRIPVHRLEWDIPPADVNAFYNPNVNTIMFLAGILQSPFFSRTQPISLNFGSIGYVMGHEITHGFDDQGRQYDKTGLLVDWWGNDTVKSFKTRAQCVVEFYSNFTVPSVGLNVNGNFTLGENLADMGGVSAAFRAHQSWLKEAGTDEPALPGLPQYNNQQLFFLGAAHTWCMTQRPEKLKQQILTDPHSPGKFRVNGPFANSQYFADTFQCAPGTPMNPVKKCRVW